MNGERCIIVTDGVANPFEFSELGSGSKNSNLMKYFSFDSDYTRLEILKIRKFINSQNVWKSYEEFF